MKKIINGVLSLAIASSAAFGWIACGSGEEEIGEGEAAATGGGCEISSVLLERRMNADEVKALGDPIAKLILTGGTCPKSFAEIQAKLREVDTDGCPDDPAKPPAGTITRFVSERSPALGKADEYRAVVSRTCGGRGPGDLMMSLFGIQGDATSLPKNVELIGRNPTSGVFNYYAVENGKWEFFGSSKDFIEGGYDCDENGACTPKIAAKTRCASCHVGGGLLMKEQAIPWVHWEGFAPMPGAEELADRFASLLGHKAGGYDLDQTVGIANFEWSKPRAAILKAKGTKELLRPLFCSVDVHLGSAHDSLTQTVPLEEVGFVNADFFVNRIAWLHVDVDRVPVQHADYLRLIAANGQKIVDRRGQQLQGPNGPVVDTTIPFVYPTRSGMDDGYVRDLVTEGIVDQDFVKDVYAIDFTRAVFSPTRCALLDAAPDLSAEQMTPDAIREGFKQNLADATGAGARLRANLSTPNDMAAHDQEIADFIAACARRPSAELLADVLAYASHTRRAARSIISAGRQGIIEFAESMPVDDLPDTTKALDPVTCTLRDFEISGDPCRGVDATGTCTGAVLEWCEGGVYKKVDCSTKTDGRTACGADPNPANGNNCIVP